MSAVLPMLQDRVTEWRWEMHPVWWMWGAGGLIMMALVLLFWILVIVDNTVHVLINAWALDRYGSETQ